MFKPHKKQKAPASELLVSRGLCASLAEASALVYAGLVVADDQRVEKPGQLLPLDVPLRVKKKGFVSRGGNKIAKAIEELGLSFLFKDKFVLDVGASSGGFTDCVLQLGASKVLALDIGFNQLDWKLRTHPQVLSLEQTDIRDFDASAHAPIDWILADISFDSLERLAPALVKAASPHTQFLILIKPQFELPRKDVPSGGVVRDEELWNKAIQSCLEAFEQVGVGHFKIAKSALKGRSGNQEFFVYCCLLPKSLPPETGI